MAHVVSGREVPCFRGYHYGGFRNCQTQPVFGGACCVPSACFDIGDDMVVAGDEGCRKTGHPCPVNLLVSSPIPADVSFAALPDPSWDGFLCGSGLLLRTDGCSVPSDDLGCGQIWHNPLAFKPTHSRHSPALTIRVRSGKLGPSFESSACFMECVHEESLQQRS